MQPHRRLYLTWPIMLRANLTFARPMHGTRRPGRCGAGATRERTLGAGSGWQECHTVLKARQPGWVVSGCEGAGRLASLMLAVYCTVRSD